MKPFARPALMLAVPVCAASANAANLVRPYMGLKLGAGFEQAVDVDFNNPRVHSSIDHDYSDTTLMGGVSAGLRLTGAPVRVELEYAYRDDASFTRDDNVGTGA